MAGWLRLWGLWGFLVSHKALHLTPSQHLLPGLPQQEPSPIPKENPS